MTDPADTISATVTWITDGDTIEVEADDEALTVRLDGINTPDRGECHYDEALNHLIETLKGKQVSLEIAGTDQFDRVLAHVFADDRHINREMVAGGLALATSSSDDSYAGFFLEVEEQAYASGIGLWAVTACGSETQPAVEIDPESSTPDAPGPDDEELESETVVVVNRSESAVDLSRWMLRDGSSRHRYTFADGAFLESGGRFAVTSADPGWSPGREAVWSNDGDIALLLDPVGNVVSRWRY